MKTKLTVAEKVLLACFEIGNKQSFSSEALAVKCWELFPNDFSLQGFKNHTDSNKVYTQIMNAKSPLYKNGWLIKVGEKMYKISENGSKFVINNLKDTKNLNNDIENSKKDISREFKTKFNILYNKQITQKIIKNSNLSNFDFDDVCDFWSITTDVRYPELVGKLENLNACLETISSEFNSNVSKVYLDKDIYVEKKHLNALKKAQKYFVKEFSEDINYIKKNRSNIVYKNK